GTYGCVVADLDQVELGEVGRADPGPSTDPGAEPAQYRWQERSTDEQPHPGRYGGRLLEAGDGPGGPAARGPQRVDPRAGHADDVAFDGRAAGDHRDAGSDGDEWRDQRRYGQVPPVGEDGQGQQVEVEAGAQQRGGQRGAEELDPQPLPDQLAWRT